MLGGRVKYGQAELKIDGEEYAVLTLGSGAWPDGLKEFEEFAKFDDLLKKVWIRSSPRSVRQFPQARLEA